ncbi:protein OSCP1a isoform X2 [Alosa sapidissima]|uniref:protein OSCP1a isoform X2 n=1 Tax=Alosa sapidissima TaxID=34773 RepID=UPI001C087CE1|nr:protein OSCP1a isoform X2 [Alosa sapidissima]
MSLKTLPLLVMNLGGEMLYVLDQRLQAPNIPEDKSQKVMSDIISTMFNKPFMEELLRPQDIYSHRAMRTLLTRIAHASIMRLNPASMDKLYDLMIMAFKYQVQLCPRPRDLLLVTLNHIDTIKSFVRHNPRLSNQIDEAQRQLIEMYKPLTDGEFHLIRQTLLIFLQDMHVRVSVFLREKLQNANGHFVLSTSGPVPQGSDVPGLIRLFNNQGKEVKRCEFPSGGTYTSPVREGSFDMAGDRVTRLGTNMYSESAENTQTSGSPKFKQNSQADTTPNPLAKEELNLLAKLMGGMEVQDSPSGNSAFRVNLFTTDQEEEEAGTASETHGMFSVINIQATKDHRANSELARIAGEFTDHEENSDAPSSKGDHLLSLMDDL